MKNSSLKQIIYQNLIIMPMLYHYSSQYKTKLFDYRRTKEQHKSSALHSFSMSFNYSKNKHGSLGSQRCYMFS